MIRARSPRLWLASLFLIALSGLSALLLVAVAEVAFALPQDLDPKPAPEDAGVPPPPIVPGATADDVAARIWSGWSREPAGFETDAPIAAAEFDGRLHAFAKRRGGPQIFLQTFSGTPGAWDGAWIQVPGRFVTDDLLPPGPPRPGLQTDVGVAVAATTDQLYLFARDVRRPRRLWLNSKTAGTAATQGWTGWGAELLPLGETDAAPAAVATSRFGFTHIYVVRKGLDGGVSASVRLPSGSWFPWKLIDGPTSDLAPAAASDDDRIYVFRVETGSGAIHVNTLEKTSLGVLPFGPACRVNGGVSTNAPVAAVRDGDALRLFHKGFDGRIYAQTLVDPRPYGRRCGYWSLPAEVRGGGLTDAGLGGAYVEAQQRLFVLVQGLDAGVWANVNTVLSLPLHALRLADSDGAGGCSGFPAGVTTDHVTRWVEYANRAFAPAFIRFRFDPATDWGQLCDTELNVKQPPLAKAMAAASFFPGKIVVFFRARSDGNGYSWWDLASDDPWDKVNFVLMPGFDDTTVCGHQNLAQLAHDLGHYLGLPHTFPLKAGFVDAAGDPDIAAARTWILDGKNMDGDGFSDTPEDPSIAVAKQCGPGGRLVRFRVTPSLVLTYFPQRTNVMSYYSDDVSTWIHGPLIQTITPDQTERIYRTIAERGLLRLDVAAD